ncbi:hypothetical protein [Acidianus ambivalens]|uniref:Uncharacterized protein n=1 Tax=Acidianus ambivalens TaxID=2283 RepID=A0A650CTY2_ACIAM|nr:hypothetical protein [Acidianus ambivalens]MQL56209.1 hypothetical protein [Acidianus ambivalens]QGR21253.1 hypothetical protein D1866_03985 [Acidianus ambivalens]
MLEVYVIFGLMAFSLVLSGVMTLVLLGIAENDIVSSLGIYEIPRIELRLIFIISLFSIFDGVLESFVLSPQGIILSFESIPYLIVIFSKKLRRF